MEEEIWKPLVYNGVEYDAYEVCNFGEIRSLDRYVEQKSIKGNIYKRYVKGTIVKSFIAAQYEHVRISANGNKNIHILVHRAVAESFVPNPNKEKFTDVNHIDENKLNNRWDNLEWCTKSYNQKYYAERHPEEKLKNLYGENYKEKIFHACPICGKMTKNKVCCSVKCQAIKTRKAERPSREELKMLVRSKSFLSISKMLGVSDNSIRKWCKCYNIPFKQKDIKSYTDEEWEKI